MFNFITSFKKDVKAFIANAETRFKALEAKVDLLLHPHDVVDAAATKVAEAVEDEVKKVD